MMLRILIGCKHILLEGFRLFGIEGLATAIERG